ncbi:hypothetical protein SAMN05660209_03301 [Geodermatophilus africanus]|uniref:CBS domain-containing protein n=1 Tax=Geodermatophilus africanus TaxID=1137993 RepID=A0A1H3LDX4_9ACTN|nr:hypothetical protein [Geodermatophilus africanus]SDY62536.1 hypothetical protein SAMN05660209_03301 [Geodermatophilus africanus]
MASSDLDAFDAAWRYLETLARQSTGARDTDAALAELRRRGEIGPGEHSQLDGARKIRNALTHSTLLPGNVPLAVPTGALVELLRIVTSRLSNQPPRIGDLAVPAHQVRADMPVHAALQDLIARDFSQAPYKAASGDWQLFTAEQVARWLALHDDGPVTFTGTTVADLAEFGPTAPAAEVKPTTSTQAAVDQLVAALGNQEAGVVPVLLVRDRKNPADLALFTPADLPRAQPLVRPITAVTATA